ncbi:MAG: hypothetical protein ACJA1E_002115 [Paracoccaceae bacterium]|jgi:hypothetical protein
MQLSATYFQGVSSKPGRWLRQFWRKQADWQIRQIVRDDVVFKLVVSPDLLLTPNNGFGADE